MMNDNELLEKTNYNILCESYKMLEQKMKTLQNKYNDLLIWKKNHNCNNVNINFKNIDKHKEIILQLNKNIKIKYNPLYLELKYENEILRYNYNIQKNVDLFDFDNINNDKLEKNKKTNKDLPFLNCPIININKNEDLDNIDWKIHVSTEIHNIIKNNYGLYEKICKDKNVNRETLNEAIIYIIKKRDMKDTRQNRHYIRKTLLRSFYIYNTYKDKLKYISFNFSKMVKISNKNWNVFLEYLNNVINNIKTIKYELPLEV